MIYSRDIPFWSENLDLLVGIVLELAACCSCISVNKYYCIALVQSWGFYENFCVAYVLHVCCICINISRHYCIVVVHLQGSLREHLTSTSLLHRIQLWVVFSHCPPMFLHHFHHLVTAFSDRSLFVLLVA